jgi:flavin reductase (DIM6/NTAB) family NADH-FMN oxidoreductase RutF
MPQKLLKYKNYDVQAVTVATPDGRKNANIVTWAMQVAMGGKMIGVALYKIDYTLELVRQAGRFNLNLLAQDQTRMIQRLGRQSGRDTDKFQKLPHALDEHGCPYLTEAIGYVQCRVLSFTDAGDHLLVVAEVDGQRVLHPEKTVLTHHYLREKKLVRG